MERLSIEQIQALDCFIVPKNTALPTALGVVKHAATIFDLVREIESSRDKESVVVLDFPNDEVLNLINRKPDLFPIAAAVLDGVPGADYEVIFKNSSFNLPLVDMTELLKAMRHLNEAVNHQAQVKMGSTQGGTAEERVEAQIEKRAARISDGAVRRAASRAPQPVSLSDHHTRSGGDADEPDDGDADGA